MAYKRPTRKTKRAAKPATKPSAPATPERKPLPLIARRALALVNVELQKTILEAAQLVGVNPADGWKITSDFSAFVKSDKPDAG